MIGGLGKMRKEIEHEYTDELICPYCGHENKTEYDAPDYETEECNKCGEEFKYDHYIEITYTTYKIKVKEDA